MLRTLFSGFFLLTSLLGVGQNMDAGCGHRAHAPTQKKYPWVGNVAFAEQYLAQIDYANRELPYYQVPVQFWIYTDSVESPSVDAASLKAYIEDLNRLNAQNRTGLHFYMLPEPKYVTRRKHQEIRWDFEASWVTWRYRHRDVVNVHLVQELVKKKYLLWGAKKKEFRGLYNTGTRGIVIRSGSSNTTLTHEVGHYFGLHHTHRDAHAGKKKQEAVQRELLQNYRGRKVPKCSLKGDQLCDTPADPNIGWFVNDSCQFTGIHLRDAWGQAYQPDVSNLMGYPRLRQCRHSFSQGQKAVMLYTAAQETLARVWALCDTSAIADAAEPDHLPSIYPRLQPDSTYQRSLHALYPSSKALIDNDYFELILPQARKLKLLVQSTQKSHLQVSLNGKQLDTSQLLDLPAGRHLFQITADMPVQRYVLQLESE